MQYERWGLADEKEPVCDNLEKRISNQINDSEEQQLAKK